jgi:hypothetical protein
MLKLRFGLFHFRVPQLSISDIWIPVLSEFLSHRKHTLQDKVASLLNSVNTVPWIRKGERRYSSTILNLDTTWQCVVNFTPLPPYSQGKCPDSQCIAGWVGVRNWNYIRSLILYSLLWRYWRVSFQRDILHNGKASLVFRVAWKCILKISHFVEYWYWTEASNHILKSIRPYWGEHGYY